MRKNNLSRGNFPDPLQQALLYAALFKGPRSIEAWENWKSQINFENVDGDSYLLLPLLYRNLNQQDVQDPLLLKLKGIYRLNWAKNQRLFHRVLNLLEVFYTEKIDVLLLKGAALTLSTYGDYGVRIMGDFDFMVQVEKVPQSISLLVQHGWKPVRRNIKIYSPNRHACNLGNGMGENLDFHWHLFHHCCWPGADEIFWRGAISRKIENISVKFLNPTDQLTHICVHGARGDCPATRWVADAIQVIMKFGPEINWDCLIDHAQRFHVILHLRENLIFLRNHFNLSIPDAIIDNLMKLPTAKIDYQEYKWFGRSRKFFGEVPLLWFVYLRRKRSSQNILNFFSFPKYLQEWYGLKYFWQLPYYLFVKGVGKIKRKLTRIWLVLHGSVQWTKPLEKSLKT